ncbi:Uncharacterised protein [Niallia circulans]|jgi:hypothetical protein|nr:Uncharacterised protein [Niallia circulans]
MSEAILQNQPELELKEMEEEEYYYKLWEDDRL